MSMAIAGYFPELELRAPPAIGAGGPTRPRPAVEPRIITPRPVGEALGAGPYRVGERHNFCELLEKREQTKSGQRWLVRCHACEARFVTFAVSVRSGRTKSCGCMGGGRPRRAA